MVLFIGVVQLLMVTPSFLIYLVVRNFSVRLFIAKYLVRVRSALLVQK